jgi:hypothetical protein
VRVEEGVGHPLQCIQSCCHSVFTPSFISPLFSLPFSSLIVSLFSFLSPSHPLSSSHSHSPLLFFSSSPLLFLQAEAPLNTIMRLLRHLIPQVAHLTQDQSGADELQIIQFIRRTTMVRHSDRHDAMRCWWDVT